MQSGLEAGVETGEAERTLQEIERVRRSTRRALHQDWAPNVVVGVFFLGATLAAAVATGPGVPRAYWAIGVPVGLALIVWLAIRRERELGVESRAADPGLGIFAATIAGVIVINRLTDSDVAWAYAVSVGWLVTGAVFRDALLAAAGAALALIATGLIAAGPDGAGLWAQLALGLLLIAVGLVGRAQERA